MPSAEPSSRAARTAAAFALGALLYVFLPSCGARSTLPDQAPPADVFEGDDASAPDAAAAPDGDAASDAPIAAPQCLCPSEPGYAPCAAPLECCPCVAQCENPATFNCSCSSPHSCP